MARFEDERGRSNQMTWGEGNGHRRRPASQRQYGGPGEYGGWGSGEGQGEYGDQGYSAMGEFTGRGFGGPDYGWQDYEEPGYSRPDYYRQAVGWQPGPAGGYGYGRGAGWQQRSFGGPDFGDEGRYGGWREPGYGGYGTPGGLMNEGYGPRGVAGPGRGWPSEVDRGIAGPEWGGQARPGTYGYGDWEVSPAEQRPWEQGRFGGWGERRFAGPGHGIQGRELAGPMDMFRETLAGPFSGRGPRGYQRSDARIEEDVNERLTRHGMIDASDIDVKVTGGEVTLSGMVDSRRDKRMAEDAIETISGVKDINNQLRVRQERMGQGEAQAASGAARGQSQSRGQTPRGETAKAAAGRSQAA